MASKNEAGNKVHNKNPKNTGEEIKKTPEVNNKKMKKSINLAAKR